MKEMIVALRGTKEGTESVMVDVILDARHPLGWKGRMVKDRTSFEPVGDSAVWLRQDWTEYGYILRSKP